MKKLNNYYNVKQIYTVNPHFSQQERIKKYPINVLDITPILMNKLKNFQAIGVDDGTRLRFELDSLDKKRIGQKCGKTSKVR